MLQPVRTFVCTTHPVLIVISGPSGVGKDTIARMVIDERPDDFHFVVTATTRPPRPNEVDGVDYIFVSNNDFAEMIEQDELLEYAIVYGDYKGVPKQQIREALASNRNVIMRVDVQGVATIRKIIPEAITVFLTTRTEEELVERLQNRDSETNDSLKLRIAMARKEFRRLSEFDYCVVNDSGRADEAVSKILGIVDAAQCRVEQRPIEL